MTLTDTHCHLTDAKFDPDRAEVLKRARQAGVTRILAPGTDLESSRQAVALAEAEPEVFAAVGIHPEDAADYGEEAIPALRELASHPKVKAIGEIGLDYYWKDVPHNMQQQALEAQLDLALELHLPVVLHLREKGDAPDGPCARDLLAMLQDWVRCLVRDHDPLEERPGVLHSFSGSMATAEEAMRLGFLLGVTGPVTHQRERQKLVAGLPLSSLLIETDAPYLAPVPWRGRRNEPAYVRHIADKIAELQGCSAQAVKEASAAAAARLFSWT